MSKLQYLFVLLLLVFIFPPYFLNMPAEGLDMSWQIAIGLAHKYGLVFGRDFVFSYGPLGILDSRIPIAVSKYVYLGFDIYFLLSMLFAVRYIFRKHFSYVLVFLMGFAFILGNYQPADSFFFLLYLFYLFAFLKEPRVWGYLVQAAVLSIITFYIKGGGGLFTICIFLISVVYLFVLRRISLAQLLSILPGCLLGVWVGAILLNVDLMGYLVSGWHLIDGYDDAMYLALPMPLKQSSRVAVFLLFLFDGYLFAVARKAIRERSKYADEVFIYGVVALSSFVLFKAAFVRADGHILLFFRNISLLGGLLFVFRPQFVPQRLVGGLFCVLISVSLIETHVLSMSLQPGTTPLSTAVLSDRIRAVKNYFAQLRVYDSVRTSLDQLDEGDNAFKRIIGKHTADVVPTEISRVFFNGLHYDPRPVIQSYAVYDGWLDSLNSAKYKSASAPEFLLFNIAPTDWRPPFYDEARTSLAVLQRYRLMEKVQGVLVLKKRDRPIPMGPAGQPEEIVAKLGQEIRLKKSRDIQFAKIYVKYSLWGRLRRLVDKPPVLEITITPEGGAPHTFRAIKPILEGGVILNKFVDNEDEFKLFMLSQGRMATGVEKIKIDGENGSKGFVDDIRIVSTYLTPGEPPAGEKAENEVELLRVEQGQIPRKVDMSQLSEKPFEASIDYFSGAARHITVRGWAFGDSAIGKVTVGTFLRSGDNAYELPTETLNRPDLVQVYKRQDVLAAGFVSKVMAGALPEGNYRLGIILRPSGGAGGVWSYMPDSLVIKHSYQLDSTENILAGSGKNGLFSIDKVDTSGNISIEGWSFVPGLGCRGMTYLLLRSGSLCYRVATARVARPDVVKVFPQERGIQDCGFRVVIPLEGLRRGDYTVGVETISCDGGRAVNFSDKRLSVK